MIKPLLLALTLGSIAHAAVQITVVADSGRIPISPYIFGKNDRVTAKTTQDQLTIFRDAGLRMMRSNGGNNASKYNWARHLTSHPDWYNNVYRTNWDDVANRIQTQLPECSGLFAFQLTGWAAKDTMNNFDDWAYNQAQYWSGVHQNLAGGGVPNGASGNPNKYLMPWPADSTAGILAHWFGPGGLGLDSNRFRYWNMDNEVEIWDGTHDDIYPTQPTAEEFIQKYVKVAVAVRKHFPGVKLVAPASPSEWQWYNWKPGVISYKGKTVSWPEYFIWRLKEAQDSTGVRMLDVYDVHFYPGDIAPVDLVQEHRVWFDTTYEFANSNGVRLADGNWKGEEKKQYFFERVNRWLAQYFGTNHGIGLGATESAIMTGSPETNLSTIWYASMLGTFADRGVEVFTPWSWDVGQYEVLHLFSKKGHDTRVLSRSSLDSLVSAYSSISKNMDSLTVILVNRDLSNEQSVTVNLKDFAATGVGSRLQLSGLGTAETFQSETQNALVQSTVNISGNTLSLSLPAKSVTAFQFNALSSSSSSSSLSSSSAATSSSSSLNSSSAATSSSSSLSSSSATASSSSSLSSSSATTSSSSSLSSSSATASSSSSLNSSSAATSSSSNLSSSSATASSSSNLSSSSSSGTTALASPAYDPQLAVRRTTGGLLIEGTDGSEFIQIFDLQGNRLVSTRATRNTTLIHLDRNGLYWMRVQKSNLVHVQIIQPL